MRDTRPIVAALVTALGCALPVSAWADPPNEGRGPIEIGANVSLGGMGRWGERERPGALFTIDATVRYRALLFGILLEKSVLPFAADSFLGVAALAGVRLRFGDVRLDLLGAAGAHAWSDVGASTFLFSQTENHGTSDTLPFLGLRATVAGEWGSRTVRGSVGLTVFYEDDLGRSVRSYQYQRASCTWFCVGPPTMETVWSTVTIGERFAGALASLGVSF